MKIIFMGTPKFACPTLEKLIADEKFEVVGVYTREPQIAGRGHKLRNSPIHQLALKNDLQVFTPKTLRDFEVQKEFINLKADAAIVVAYGLLLPQEILSGTKFGCFNIHPSQLPKWRGAAPIQRSLMAGDEETAVCIIKMDAGLDSGNIVAHKNYPLNGDETYLQLENEFSEIGAQMVIETLKKADAGNLTEKPQDHSQMSYAKKLMKSECEIDFTKSAKMVDAQIRGLSGSLGAFFNYQDQKIKIFSCKIIDENSNAEESGKILNKNFEIQCGKGIIQPQILQKSGKNKVAITEFLRGIQ